MRVGDATFYLRYLSGLGRARSRSARALEQLADGRRIRSAADDPGLGPTALRLRARIVRLEGFTRSAQSAEASLGMADQVLGDVIGLLTEARTEAMAGASIASDGANEAHAEAVRGIRDQVLSLMNTRHAGRYLFGGTETQAPPFAPDGTYSGNDEEVLAPLDTDVTVGATLSGRRAFQDGGDVLADLDALEQALRDNRPDDVRALLDDLEAELEHLATVRGGVGARLRTVEDFLERHRDESATLLKRVAEIEDADLPQVITELQQAETTADALSAAAARVLGRSLFDFLG